MKNQTSQSLVELLVAMSIFSLVISAIISLVLNVYLGDRTGREKMVATFLAKEGMEATRSIRDSSWNALTSGEHGLAIVGGKWIFQGNQDDVSSQLREGIRKIVVENISSDRKQVTSQITWTLIEGRPQNTSLITYFTNWAPPITPQTCDFYCRSIGYSNGVCRKNPRQCSRNGETHEAGGDQYCTVEPADTCCCAP